MNRFPGVDDVFYDLQRVILVDLNDQDDLNQQVVRALEVENKELPISNLRPGLELTQAFLAWRGLILNEEAHL